MTDQLKRNIKAALKINDIGTLRHIMREMTEAEHIAAADELNRLATKAFGRK